MGNNNISLDFLKDKKIRTANRDNRNFICIFLLQFGNTFVLEKTIDAKVPKGIPMVGYIYMECMIQKQCQVVGIHLKPVDTFQENNFDSEKTSEQDKELLKSRVSELFKNPKELCMFYMDKLASTWLNPTFPNNLVFISRSSNDSS